MFKDSGLSEELGVALFDALNFIGLEVELTEVEANLPGQLDHRTDMTVSVNNQLVAIEFKAAVTTSDAAQLLFYADHMSLPMMVVSRRISELARERLQASGVNFYDTRGPLRLRLPGIVIDTELAPLGSFERSVTIFDGEVAKEVALALLIDPEGSHGVRTLAREINRSPSAVLTTLRRFHTDGLTMSAHEPVLPELFWELAAAWRTAPVALDDLPKPGHGKTNELLQLGIDEDVGWALTDSIAAKAWGFGIVLSPSYPPDFYVPSIIAFQRAVALFGRAKNIESRACTIRIAPTPIACRWREKNLGSEWPVANHIVVALDLARDESRGRDLLEQWVPPEGIIRVW